MSPDVEKLVLKGKRSLATSATSACSSTSVSRTAVAAWVQNGRGDGEWGAGMTADRERELLAK